MTEDVHDILQKYAGKIEEHMQDYPFAEGKRLLSKDYELFRQELLERKVTWYERWCNLSARLLQVKVKEEEHRRLQESIVAAHLHITPEGAASFGVLVGIFFILLGIMIGAVSYAFGTLWLFTPLLFVIGGAILLKPLPHLPHYFAQRWRMEASNQMVLCILYIVIYMRHSSNLEHGLIFASEHLQGPLRLDFKKVLWDIETEQYFSIKESLDHYLEQWRNYNIEFIEAFHLIEGSLYEGSEPKRIEMLEKSLEVMLEGTYEKMLHYSHNLKSPITILYMLGIILPILGLVIFPLIGSFLSGLVKWWHLALLYNIILPLFVLGMGNTILAKRPTGYGSSDILQINPAYKQLQQLKIGKISISPLYPCLLLAGIFVFIGMTPFFLHVFSPGFDFDFLGGKFLDYKDNGNGPYGLGALLLSLFIPFGIALGCWLYYRVKSKQLIQVKETTDTLEQEFSGALFQLGNSIGNGVPAEVAFGKVAENMRGSPAGSFFMVVYNNIRNLGMGLQKAIFDEVQGGILFFPSTLIESSMQILIEAAKKGPLVASRSLLTISEYVDRIRKVNERLKDLLADILSSMKSEITFLTPLIAGIVVGVGSMVVTIINKLSIQFASLEGAQAGGEFSGIAAIANVLRIQDVIPGFQFQIVVGLYVIEIIIILTMLSTTVERGVDTTTTRYRLSKNLLTGMGLYILVSFIGILLFNFLANAVGIVSAS